MKLLNELYRELSTIATVSTIKEEQLQVLCDSNARLEALLTQVVLAAGGEVMVTEDDNHRGVLEHQYDFTTRRHYLRVVE